LFGDSPRPFCTDRPVLGVTKRHDFHPYADHLMANRCR
jgi:hypothetical protein